MGFEGSWIFLVMLAMIAGSIVVEVILPTKVKERLGAAICWGLMAVTMTFLGASTLGLIYVVFDQFIRPLTAG